MRAGPGRRRRRAPALVREELLHPRGPPAADGRRPDLAARPRRLRPRPARRPARLAVAADGGPARWLEASAPAPRPDGHPSPDTFFTGAPAPEGDAERLDIRDPRTRTFFRLEPGQMELDNLRIGAPVDAPTVSASMATALLAYSGIALKMLVDTRLGAVLHQMFMVEYEPGGAAQLARPPARGELHDRLRRGRGGGRRRALHAPRRRRLLDRRRLRPRLLEHERRAGPLPRDAVPAAPGQSLLPLQPRLGLPGRAPRRHSVISAHDP